jgi:CBS domain-containing protein/sporulation protein YlmC with PRC-barrel domain
VSPNVRPATLPADPLLNLPGARFLHFSELLKRPVCANKIGNRLGKLSDLVFELKDPYPEAVGIFLEFGWGKPTQFIPWDCVLKVDDDAVFVKLNPDGPYPPFVDQPGWMLLEEHLIGRTILDLDGRRVEVVNDVQLLEAKGRLILVHVDTSLNGILRRWGLGKVRWIRDELISWKVVQPLSVEDAVATDRVSLSVTRTQLRELPGEDLADALEELTGEQQEALFSALEPEKAAETLMEAEPRAQRQLIAGLRKERARNILSEMTMVQVSSLLAVLPHDDVEELLGLMPQEQAARVRTILSERETKAGALVSPEFLAMAGRTTVAEAIAAIRTHGNEPGAVSYVYVVKEDGRTLEGVVDLRELVLAPDSTLLGNLMASPVVSAAEDDLYDDLAEVFTKYHFRLLPVVDGEDRILGVIRYNDIMKGGAARGREKGA